MTGHSKLGSPTKEVSKKPTPEADKYLSHSPTKAKLAESAQKLPPPSPRKRAIVGTGDQSVVLDNGHKEVLVVTRYQVAKKFELLREAFDPVPKNLPFHIPKLAAMNKPIAKLQDPNISKMNEKFYRKHYSIYGNLLEDNVVFKLPRYDGTLEDLYQKRFNELIIAKLQKTLTESLALLHEKGITHNDLSPKNIYYIGEHPKTIFYLGDFGSITLNDPHVHDKACRKDFSKMNAVLSQMENRLKTHIGKDIYFVYGSAKKKHPAPYKPKTNASYSLRKRK